MARQGSLTRKEKTLLGLHHHQTALGVPDVGLLDFSQEKEVFIQQNNTFLIRDKCCHAMLCFHLLESKLYLVLQGLIIGQSRISKQQPYSSTLSRRVILASFPKGEGSLTDQAMILFDSRVPEFNTIRSVEIQTHASSTSSPQAVSHPSTFPGSTSRDRLELVCLEWLPCGMAAQWHGLT